jgi:hypothetical protein
MRKKILVIGVIALFIGIASFSAATSIDEVKSEKSDYVWQYVTVGRIKNYEIKQENDQEYLECQAILIRSFWWSDNFPDTPIERDVLRNGEIFNIPKEEVKILVPTLMGNYFIIASGART